MNNSALVIEASKTKITRPITLLVAALLALVFVIMASTAAQAYTRRYHADFNYANQVRGSGFIDNLSGGGTHVGYTPPLGFQSWSYGGTYNYANGNAYSTGAAQGEAWSSYSHALYRYGESKCWWNTSYPEARHNPQLLCDQYVG
ncbi:hypothetical protein [Pseudarthrobacter niigatensis]|uniref:Lactococcin 972 family bacteriocin n=1 Tax=Pseudarthrobacter niigatensis TaxID=369935 RepID=A0AAJ1WC22_9MICC|nr:hypothetical protein [Pseudarthrobacter niigatensis]MDQ0144599.1 hypothetical protein [Pseudarthrobacter niigatensis]MDQ0265245.1 hypothetical protein [Pseudarthrobacter niigatensis]